MEAGKGVFIKPVSGATGYSCYKTHSGEKMLASVNGIIRPLPHGATTLDSKCTGEQSLFFYCAYCQWCYRQWCYHVVG